MHHRQKNCFMTIPYRIRRGLQRFFVTAGVLLLVAIAALVTWMLWLSRYVIYTDDGAKLDFGLSADLSEGEIAQPPSSRPSVSISYGNTDDLTDVPSTGLLQMVGYTVSADMLTQNLAAVKTAVDALPADSAILLDVKNYRGEFYYESSLGRNPDNVDIEAITQLIHELDAKGFYIIARIPAFRDFWYFIDDEATRVPYGLPKSGGNGALWEDKSVKNTLHYWFNPASTGTQNYLVQIATELRGLGFDEVVFGDFRFPDTDAVKFSGDKLEALNQTAKTLVQACASDTFAVSFAGSQITLPEGRCRLYIENTPASDISELVTSLALEDPAAQLVFLTDLMDTRYESYSVLRPLDTSLS